MSKLIFLAHFNPPKAISRIFCYGDEAAINGAAKDIGEAAIVAVTIARGMEVAGAVDSVLVGQDAGKSKAWASSSISLTVLLFMTMCNGLLLLQLEFLVVQRFVISIFTVGVFS
eukprot:TRINITY_DN4505_c0_g2_i5.p2 TRINITY_DN4505_c0_g2~~TRINITY_DN4505_c0_g2_i5.p2  ORF type:complete len:114 (-),score=18.53 TRINITY_DN4505_c0_g2_i5:271-612(-)